MPESRFPAPGHSYEVRFGALSFRLDFNADGKALTFTGIGDTTTPKQTVHYTAVPIRPGVFMVYWTEADGTKVVHVEDFERGLVHTNIAGPDGSFTNLSGVLKALV